MKHQGSSRHMAPRVNFDKESHKPKIYTTLFLQANGASKTCMAVLASTDKKHPHFCVTVL